MQQICAGVRMRLRRVSDIKLPEDDIKEVVTDLLRGYSQDLRLSRRDRKTETTPVQLIEDEIDYVLDLNVPDFEAEKLEYRLIDANSSQTYEAQIVQLSEWQSHYFMGGVLVAFYGDDHVRCSLSPDEVASRDWILTYRQSLLSFIQANAPVPLPSDFVPMLKEEASIACISRVQDDSPEWTGWVNRSLVMMVATKNEWRSGNTRAPGRWEHYLVTSLEPQVQPIKRFDSFRGIGRRINPRAYFPRS